MLNHISRPLPLVLLLAVLTFLPVVVAAMRVIQIPFDALPEESLRLTGAPVSHFFHAASAVLFGVLGPLQFVFALRRHFGTLHRLSGRVFVLSGLGMAISGLGLLFQVDSIATGLLDTARGVFSLALVLALALGVRAARARDTSQHRAWMIRAYVFGMGSGAVVLVAIPIQLITGGPLVGLAADVVFVGMWLISVAVGEWVIRRLATPTPLTASADVT